MKITRILGIAMLAAGVLSIGAGLLLSVAPLWTILGGSALILVGIGMTWPKSVSYFIFDVILGSIL